MWGRFRWTRYSDLFLAAITTAAGIYFFSGLFTPVRFDYERIEVQVKAGEIRVQGLYRYSNSSFLPSVLTLKVPFPVDRDHPRPHWFALHESDDKGRARTDIIPVVRNDKVFIRQIFGPHESKWVRLDYLQAARIPTGRYLLTTTQAWGRPIDEANFVLRLPENFDLASSNFPLRPVPPEGEGKAFGFSQADFFPDRDWEFSWASAELALAQPARRRP